MLPINHDLMILHNRFTKSSLSLRLCWLLITKPMQDAACRVYLGNWPRSRPGIELLLGVKSKPIDSGLIIRGVSPQSTVRVRMRSSRFLVILMRMPAWPRRFRALRPGRRSVYLSIRESWIESSGACFTKCQEISEEAIRRNLFLNAEALVPESMGIGPRLGKVLSQ